MIAGPIGMVVGGTIAVTAAAFVTPVIVVTMRLLSGNTVAPVPAMLLGTTSGFASGFISFLALQGFKNYAIKLMPGLSRK